MLRHFKVRQYPAEFLQELLAHLPDGLQRLLDRPARGTFDLYEVEPSDGIDNPCAKVGGVGENDPLSLPGEEIPDTLVHRNADRRDAGRHRGKQRVEARADQQIRPPQHRHDIADRMLRTDDYRGRSWQQSR